MLRELIRAKPAFASSYDALFQFCIAQRRMADAEQVLLQKRRALPNDAAGVIQLANYYVETSRPDDAGKILEGMLANATAFPDRFLIVGDFYAARREYPRAMEMYRRGADATPAERKKYDTRVANALLAQNNRGEALRMLDSVVQRDAKDADARAARAAIWLDSGKAEMLAQAIRELQSLVKDHPDNASFSYTLARAYMANGDRKTARTHARNAARNNAALVPARLMVAEIDLAENRPREALPYVAEALEIEPRDVKARLLLVRALQMSRRIVEARTELDSLLKIAPQYRDAQIQAGYLQIDERKFAEAEATFRKLFRPGQDDSDAMAGIVQVLYMQKQGARALQELKADVERNPKATGMKLLLASVATRSGDRVLALRQYNDLLASGVRTADIYTSAAELHYGTGQLQEAIGALRHAYALAPARSELAVALGGIIEQAGQPDEARALYRKALETDPQNAAAMNNLAYSLAEGGQNLDEALELAKKAVQLRADPSFSHTLGWVYLKKNMSDSAVQIFRNLTEKRPDSATFRLHLGLALLASGDRTGARRELEQASRANPSATEAAHIQSLLNKPGM
jgi:predicted Zn-dependent protease